MQNIENGNQGFGGPQYKHHCKRRTSYQEKQWIGREKSLI